MSHFSDLRSQIPVTSKLLHICNHVDSARRHSSLAVFRFLVKSSQAKSSQVKSCQVKSSHIFSRGANSRDASTLATSPFANWNRTRTRAAAKYAKASLERVARTALDSTLPLKRIVAACGAPRTSAIASAATSTRISRNPTTISTTENYARMKSASLTSAIRACARFRRRGAARRKKRAPAHLGVRRSRERVFGRRGRGGGS